MVIDSHQHFWIYEETQYPWIPKNSPLHRDWLPANWQDETSHTGVDGSIAVQARQTLEESRWLLRLADQYATIKGVVGWVDLRSEKLGEQLTEFSRHSKFVGVRHVVQDEPDDTFMLRPDFLRGITRLAEFNLSYDILIFPKQLPAAIELARRFPEQRFVLDHLAKPPIKSGSLLPWREQIRELARSPNVFCKVSGMVTEARLGSWNTDDFRPYLDVVFEAFGEDRLLFGSDWPVCLLSATYAEVLGILRDYLEPFPKTAAAKIFGENAAKAYSRLNDSTPAAH
jgi:L-fuconolactonase